MMHTSVAIKTDKGITLIRNVCLRKRVDYDESSQQHGGLKEKRGSTIRPANTFSDFAGREFRSPSESYCHERRRGGVQDAGESPDRSDKNTLKGRDLLGAETNLLFRKSSAA